MKTLIKQGQFEKFIFSKKLLTVGSARFERCKRIKRKTTYKRSYSSPLKLGLEMETG